MTWDVVERLVVGFAGAALAALVGLAVTGAVIAHDGYTADSRAAVHHAEFGFPMTALTQDQSRLSASGHFPQRMTFDNPWESPTQIDEVGLLVDIAVAAAAALLAVVSVAGGIRWLWARTHLRAPSGVMP